MMQRGFTKPHSLLNWLRWDVMVSQGLALLKPRVP